MVVAALCLLAACERPSEDSEHTSVTTFGEDLDFLSQHTDVVVLSDEAENAQVAVSPTMQGRVLTSTARGPGRAEFRLDQPTGDCFR